MRRYYAAALLGAAILTTSPSLTSTFDYAQISYAESDAFDLKLSGPQIDVSASFADDYFVGASFGDFNADVAGFDVDSEIIFVRAGFKSTPSQDPHLTMYAGIEGVRVEYSYQNMTEEDTGFGGFAGLRNMVAENLELKLEAKLTQVFDESEFSGEAGLRYFLNEQFSLNATAIAGSMTGYQLGAAYHF